MFEVYSGKHVALTAESRYNAVIDAMREIEALVYCDYNGRHYVRNAFPLAYDLDTIQQAINIDDTMQWIANTAGQATVEKINEEARQSPEVIDGLLEVESLVYTTERHLRGTSSDEEDETLKRLGIIN